VLFQNDSHVGHKCRFSCRDPKRFKLVGARATRCRKNSQWKSKGESPICVEKDEKKAKKKDENEIIFESTTESKVYSTQSVLFEGFHFQFLF
jgi:hypothetical protein